MSKAYDIEAIRAQIRKKTGGGKDPTEFRPPKAEDSKEKHYRFYILPEFSVGDQLASGPASRTTETFFVEHGSHYIENKSWGCPRIINGDLCELCDYAFSLMGEIKKDSSKSDEDKKKATSAIAKDFLSASYKKVNIYFPDGKLGSVNPEELQGQVRWFNASSTVFAVWWDCLSRDDDGGDELKPLPFKVFYNEEAAYLFDLKITKKGTMNSYEGSEFIVSDKIRTLPIAYIAGMKPDREKIVRILANRHDLFTKLPDIDTRSLSRIVSNLQSGGTPASNGFDHDEENSPAARPPATRPTTKPATKSTAGEVPVESKKAAAPAPEPEVGEESWDADVESLLSQIEG